MKAILLSLALFFALGLSAQTAATIYEIQGQTSASPLENQIVTTSGIVTSLIRDYGFFLQDGNGAWNGIFVYYDNADFVTGLNRGDEVQVIGKVAEYYEKTELTDVVSATVVSSGNALPNPMNLATNAVSDEQYEGVLVHVANAVCTDTTLGFGEIFVDDGSGEVRVDDVLWSYWDEMTPTPDSTYQLTGIVDYSYDSYEILPRDAADFVKGLASIGDDEISGLEVYPNPLTDGKLYLNADSRIKSVTVFNMIGQPVFKAGEINENQASVDLSDLSDGVYLVRIESVKGKSAIRRIMID